MTEEQGTYETATPYPLSPEDEEQERLIQADGLPEAGGVVWTDLYTRLGQKVSVTARARTVRQAIDAMNDAVLYAHEAYGWVGAAHVGAGSSAGRKSAPATPEQVKQVQEKEEQEGATGDSVVTRYEVSKRPDGRGELKMYEPAHRFPDFTVVFDIPALANMLKGVNSISGRPWEQVINSGGEAGDVQWKVAWKFGKMKSSGKSRYKDVLSISM
jgi:hypothetical protein